MTSRFQKNLEARRAHSRRMRARLAELVSEGWSVSAAGRSLNVSQQRSSQMWRQIRDELGPQADA